MTAADIVRRVATARGITCSLLRSRNRTKHVVRARHEAMYLLRWCLELSTPAIAREVGLKDHTTVLHGLAKMEEATTADDDYMTDVWEIATAPYVREAA